MTIPKDDSNAVLSEEDTTKLLNSVKDDIMKIEIQVNSNDDEDIDVKIEFEWRITAFDGEILSL